VISKIGSSAIVLLFLAALTACSTTARGIGYLNPEHHGYRLTKTAVYVNNSGEFIDRLEKEVVAALNAKGVAAIGVRDKARFAKNDQDFQQKVWAEDINEVIILVVSDSSGSSVGGYQTFGSANTVGTTTSGLATTVPIVVDYRSMTTAGVVYKRGGDKVWKGGTELNVRGRINVGDDKALNVTVKSLMGALSKDGLVTK